MRKAVIIFATREGQTEKIANKIRDHLLESGCSVDIFNVNKLCHFKIEKYDFIICGGSMHAGGLEKELVQFIKKNQSHILSVGNTFFLTLLSAATKDPKLRQEWLADAKHKLEQQIPNVFSTPEMFAGALMYSRYPWPLKFAMKRIAKKAGEGTDTSRDYEYTNWNQVKSYADKIAKKILKQ